MTDTRVNLPAFTRFIVRESYGFGHRGGLRINETSAPRVLARSTVNGLIREYRQYHNDHARRIQDVDSAGWRLITARHWINGFENVRVLHIAPASIYNLVAMGLDDE